jgi:diguanylate cyclase (GGDEF)-like protein/PAS domain S-box-containing protein
MASPFYQVKFAVLLILITLLALIIGQFFQNYPIDETEAYQDKQRFSESLAQRLFPVVLKGDFAALESILDKALANKHDIRSVTVHTQTGNSLKFDNHRNTSPLSQEQLTTYEIKVPIQKEDETLGDLEVIFQEQGPISHYTHVELGLLALLTGLMLYLFFNRKLLGELSAKSIIPERVKSAFNALSEGLLILDEKHKILLVNDSFTNKTGYDPHDLLGKTADQLLWKQREGTDLPYNLPWHVSLNNCERVTGIPVRFEAGDHNERIFSVNSAPIFNNDGQIRGVLATFDDMTELEKHYRQLKSALLKLRLSEKALRNKTIELEFLATRDPLTGCLNRRAFFNKLDQFFKSALKEHRNLVFMMVDIDHFKYINDHYGHANGDKVIKYISEVLSANSRPEDVVGRYGGDEFALVLPDANTQQAIDIAERLRMDILQKCHTLFTKPQTVTVSIGLAALEEYIDDTMLLINNADHALYEAKEKGRNCVIGWTPDLINKLGADSHSAANTIIDPTGKDKTETERLLQTEILRLEDLIRQLESELEYTREEIKRREGKDDITGLPNRYIFNDRINQELARCERNKQSTCIIALDVDNFSRINEALGFTVGDQILKLIAERLIVSLRKTDTIAVIDDQNDTDSPNISRLNKDEFASIISGVSDIKSVTWVAQRILSRLKKPMHVGNQELYLSFSMGIAIYPYDDDTPNGLLQKATTARRVAKKDLGSNRIRFFSREINRQAFHSIWLESQLHKAIVRQQFELVYQPKVNIQTGRITSMEALARWSHPKVGPIPPSEFIPIAEHTGLINKLGIWVFRRATADLRRWHKLGFRDLQLAVNLSAVQLRDIALAEKFLRICQKRKIKTSKIELEVTESTLIENFDQTRNVMLKLHEAGISFALDDFGKGFSSLNYLQKLPISSIKIDRTFLNSILPDTQAQAIVTAIISLAKSLDLKVVAEGVETESQQHVLQQLHCDEIQGTLISAPVTVDEAEIILRQFNTTE